MAIKISGTTVVDDSRNLSNIANSSSSNTASAFVVRDGSGNFSAGTITAALSGNASTAATLETPRTIGGVSFDGSANINLPGVNTAGNQDTSGNASTASTLQTARTINGVSFNGSANIETNPSSGAYSNGYGARTVQSGGSASGGSSGDIYYIY